MRTVVLTAVLSDFDVRSVPSSDEQAARKRKFHVRCATAEVEKVCVSAGGAKGDRRKRGDERSFGSGCDFEGGCQRQYHQGRDEGRRTSRDVLVNVGGGNDLRENENVNIDKTNSYKRWTYDLGEGD